MASPKKRKSGHRRDDLDVFMDKANDAAEEWLRNNPAIKKLLDAEGPTGSSVAASSATVESDGEEFSKLASVANPSSDAGDPASIVSAAEEAKMSSQAVWSDTARSNRIKALDAVAGKLGFAGQTPGDMLDAIEDHLEALGKQTDTPTVKAEITKWTQNRDRLELLIRDDPESISFWEKQGEPTKIAEQFTGISDRELKATKLARATLWKGDPKFDTTGAPPTAPPSSTPATGTGGGVPTPPAPNLDDAYEKVIRAAKATESSISVANIQSWTKLPSDQATAIMARMHDEGILGPRDKKGGRPLISKLDVVEDAPPPTGSAAPKTLTPDAPAPKPPTTPGRFDKFFGGVKGAVKKGIAAEGEGLAEAGALLSKGKILKGLGRGLGTWTGGAALALGPMMLGGAIRRGLESNPWGESESSAQDRETARLAMDPGDLLNRVRLQEMQKANAMQALMSNPQLQAALQKQIRGREMMRTGKVPGDVVLGGRPDDGPFGDPEGLMALLQGR